MTEFRGSNGSDPRPNATSIYRSATWDVRCGSSDRSPACTSTSRVAMDSSRPVAIRRHDIVTRLSRTPPTAGLGGADRRSGFRLVSSRPHRPCHHRGGDEPEGGCSVVVEFAPGLPSRTSADTDGHRNLSSIWFAHESPLRSNQALQPTTQTASCFLHVQQLVCRLRAAKLAFTGSRS